MGEDTPRTQGDAQNSSKQPLSLDTVFDILSNQRRRAVLHQLIRCKYPVSFEELVETVATAETTTDSTEISDQAYEHVALDLYHTQLPTLAQHDVIEYDEAKELIQLADTIRPLDEHLHLAEQQEQTLQLVTNHHSE